MSRGARRLCLAAASAWLGVASAFACGGGEFTEGSGDAASQQDGTIEGGDDSGGDGAGDVRHDGPHDAESDHDAIAVTDTGGGETGVESGLESGTDACSATEDCANGIDDDCDGLTDCQDPQCAAQCACAPASGGGWFGPVEMWSGASGNTPPACDPGYSQNSVYDGGADLTADASCTPCSCSAPEGARCYGEARFWVTGQACFGNTCATATVAEGTCTQVSLGAGCTGASFDSGWPDGGACAHDGGDLQSASSFDTAAIACLMIDDGGVGKCDAGGASVPKPGPGYLLCLVKKGDVGCPSGWTDKHVFYEGTTDTLSCGACGCGDPSGITCSRGQLEIHDNTGCDGGTTQVVDSGGCLLALPVGVNSVGLDVRGAAPGGGSCAPSGGALDGGVAPATPTTFCCLP